MALKHMSLELMVRTTEVNGIGANAVWSNVLCNDIENVIGTNDIRANAAVITKVTRPNAVHCQFYQTFLE